MNTNRIGLYEHSPFNTHRDNDAHRFNSSSLMQNINKKIYRALLYINYNIGILNIIIMILIVAFVIYYNYRRHKCKENYINKNMSNISRSKYYMFKY